MPIVAGVTSLLLGAARVAAQNTLPAVVAGIPVNYDVDQLPMDGHMLVSLVAPRPVLLQTGTTDGWSDPRGEWLSAVAAAPVFRLLGRTAPEGDATPPAGTLVPGTLGYCMHEGGHGTVPPDWPVFLEFLTAHLKP